MSYRQNLTASTKALDQIFGYDDIEQLTSWHSDRGMVKASRC